jgi:pyruvate-formate lyase-activating enzyme
MDKRILQYREDFAKMKAGGVVRPLMATVFPSYGCNFHCPGCHYNAENESGWKFIEMNPLLSMLSEARDYGLVSVVFCGGGGRDEIPQISLGQAHRHRQRRYRSGRSASSGTGGVAEIPVFLAA